MSQNSLKVTYWLRTSSSPVCCRHTLWHPLVANCSTGCWRRCVGRTKLTLANWQLTLSVFESCSIWLEHVAKTSYFAAQISCYVYIHTLSLLPNTTNAYAPLRPYSLIDTCTHGMHRRPWLTSVVAVSVYVFHSWAASRIFSWVWSVWSCACTHSSTRLHKEGRSWNVLALCVCIHRYVLRLSLTTRIQLARVCVCACAQYSARFLCSCVLMH